MKFTSLLQADELRDVLTIVFCILVVGFIVTGVVAGIGALLEPKECRKRLESPLVQRTLKFFCSFLAVVAFVLVFVPSTKSLMTIVAVDFVTGSEEVEEISPKAVDALNKLLDDYLESSDAP